jgi:mannose/cellobiose epimerase-like protein (N-acyl-D-glucosamine 2-epimerase family)
VRSLIVDDARPGAWWHELDADNNRVERTWTGAPDVYHALQAVLLPSYDLAPGLAVAVREAARP